MKIVHINLCGPVTDNWTYQDNLLTKYQVKNGHEVTMITSQYVWGTNGKITIDNKQLYINEDDVKVIRLKNKFKTNINSKFKLYKNLFRNINKENPDIIFVHGVQFLDLLTIIKFMKHNSKVKLYIDNHADLNNSAQNFFSKWILHRVIWRFLAQKILPYTQKFYGVLPARVKFLEDFYSIPSNLTELLVLGADDEYIKNYINDERVVKRRREFDIDKKDFLIVTGGKIDNGKKQIINLMKAINNINNANLKLLIFGSIDPTLKQEFDKNLTEKIRYIGWINAKETYEIFNTADLVCFPGGHSVFWEQVVAIGKPLLVKDLDGISHLDFGGNIKYLRNDSSNEMTTKINQILANENDYIRMQAVAQSSYKENFYYSVIARKSIDN
ncbi:hypothetical protein JEOAER750_01042 [Jeotgalicoccus aerolatus]|uniref:Glycosyltransferase involved in cell wall biosynthesis n=1 Tax=Jeotgalicoccus aerolatus TaxID=709510 RepID=A0ABS4HLX6_9STAP|nr:glycosyltransferase [Jeotgalicoccus aerolatus]MBP1951900.1 glycosyltransferase involved in cell wall biosynthesis [Jeotgalicoccus aerolatus]GGD93861.1 hypothetical protein GCM10007273_02760 [Jeotgalicoccus aerolatus]CAD2074892.1 hypothetical protein JEOAER750_01042 [Jeotgalicoccus aerolatus]